MTNTQIIGDTLIEAFKKVCWANRYDEDITDEEREALMSQHGGNVEGIHQGLVDRITNADAKNKAEIKKLLQRAARKAANRDNRDEEPEK